MPTNQYRRDYKIRKQFCKFQCNHWYRQELSVDGGYLRGMLLRTMISHSLKVEDTLQTRKGNIHLSLIILPTGKQKIFTLKRPGSYPLNHETITSRTAWTLFLLICGNKYVHPPNSSKYGTKSNHEEITRKIQHVRCSTRHLVWFFKHSTVKKV